MDDSQVPEAPAIVARVQTAQAVHLIFQVDRDWAADREAAVAEMERKAAELYETVRGIEARPHEMPPVDQCDVLRRAGIISDERDAGPTPSTSTWTGGEAAGWYGVTRPIDDNRTTVGREQNRRTELFILTQ